MPTLRDDGDDTLHDDDVDRQSPHGNVPSARVDLPLDRAALGHVVSPRSRSYIVLMTTLDSAFKDLSDRDLVAEMKRLAARECQATAAVIACLAEFDARRLYLGEGCASLFAYATAVLRLSESAAYHRIEAARAARRFPVILARLADGELTLTAVRLLAPHLNADNHLALLDEARHRSKRDVERLVARVAPQPDVLPSVRKLPAVRPIASVSLPRAEAGDLAKQTARPLATTESGPAGVDLPAVAPAPRPAPAVIQPLTPERYRVQVTVSAETHAKLRRAQDLLRHVIPDGDPAAVIDRALTLLVEHLERTRAAAAVKRPRPDRANGSSSTRHPKPGDDATPARRSRHIPAAVRRAVWARDAGQCTFAGPEGRCQERGFLEYHHRVPFARGGAATVESITLLCASHNRHQAERDFGPGMVERAATRPLVLAEPSRGSAVG